MIPVRLNAGQVLQLVMVLAALGLLGWAGLQSWRAGAWKDTAKHNAEAAQTAQANADSANAGAANATETRAKVDATATAAREAAAPSVERILRHDSPPAATPGPVPAGVLRELAEGERRARAAADRLQREGER